AIKANGSAQFTIDIREPGMLTVLVARPPRFGGKVASFDAAATRSVAGVVDVKQIPSGVAVYAQGFWPASKGRDLLSVTWDEQAAERRSSAQLIEEYRALAQRPGGLVSAKGDAEAALRGAERVIEAEFVFPYLAHAPMEPLDGYLRWDGARALARLGSQLQTGDHMTIARILGLTPHRVEVATMLAGRQLRPTCAAGHAFCRGACRGRQGHRPGSAGEADVDAGGRYPRRPLPFAVRAPAARRPARRQDRGVGKHQRRSIDSQRVAVRGDHQGRHRSDLRRGGQRAAL